MVELEMPVRLPAALGLWRVRWVLVGLGGALGYDWGEGGVMEIPGKVAVYCPLIDAKGTSAKLIAVLPEGYYQLETAVKGRTHTMFLPVSQAALVFTEPEPEPEDGIEIER
jgi:hypothetical protein